MNTPYRGDKQIAEDSLSFHCVGEKKAEMGKENEKGKQQELMIFLGVYVRMKSLKQL